MRLQSSLQSFAVAVALVCVCCSGFYLSPERVLASAVVPRPTIAEVSREKKTLVVIGQNFVVGAKILINELSVGDDGVRVVSSVWNIGNGFGIDMKCEGVQCFTNSGLIIDPEAMTRRAFIQIGYDSSNDFIFSTSVVPDTRRGRVCYLIERQSGVYIDAYDITTLKKVASYKIPNLNKSVFDFLIWNDDQCAFSTLDEVVLVPMSLLQPVH